MLSRERRNQTNSENLAVVATAVTIIATACLGLSSFVEYVRTPSPSILVQIALSTFLILDLALLRTSWVSWASFGKMSDRLALAALQTSASAMKLGALLWESQTKRTSLEQNPELQHFSPEERSGFFGRTFMTWLNPVFALGYHASLKLESLQAIDESLSGQDAMARLGRSWASTNQTRRWCLAIALSRAFWVDLLLVHVPRLGLVACSITQPLLINSILTYMGDHDSDRRNHGYFLILAAFLTYALLTVSSTS